MKSKNESTPALSGEDSATARNVSRQSIY